jgi:hypothetical protein
MKEWIESQIANGLSAFPGLTLSGRVPVKEELINELLAAWLRDGVGPARSGTASPPSGQAPDLTSLMRSVKRASIHAEAGVVTLDFEFRV